MIEIKKIWFEGDWLFGQDSSGKIYKQSILWYRRLVDATEEQRNNYELSDEGMHWRCIDEDISFDSFIEELVDGREEYFGIQVVQNLHEVLGSLIDSHGSVSSIDELVTDKILDAGTELDSTEIGIKFNSDSESGVKDDGTVVKVAIVDDDVVVRKLLQDTFSQISAETYLYETGLSFLQAVNTKKEFDLVILDIFIPDMDGLSVLSSLQRQNFRAPIIIYSQATQREYVIQALTLGAKSYLVKPQKPSVILQKSVEVLNGQFRY